MIAILHSVRSVYNVASIFRTADGVGTEKIYLCGITPTPLNRVGKLRQQFTKVSLGAEKFVQWEKVGQTYRLLDKLKQDGYTIFAIEQSKKSLPYYTANLSKVNFNRLGLIVGNEVKGLPPGVLKRTDATLEIPMTGKKESLNVAVAFGIVAYHLTFA